MASTKHLLFQASRHRLHNPQPHSSLFRRWLSSDPDPNRDSPPPISPRPRPQPIQIQPVSYAVKPKPETPPNEGENPRTDLPRTTEPVLRGPREFSPENRTNWTREDARYMKVNAEVAPVLYPTRVAPLPEDRVAGEGEESGVKENERVEGLRVRSTMIRAPVEKEEKAAVVPFPRLIMPRKKENRPLLDLMDAIREVKANARKKVDDTVEAHVKLGIEKSRSDLIVRGTLTLPNGGEKVLRVAVFAEGPDADEARASGADVVGGSELIDEIASAGKIDFDKCFTTKQLYSHVAKLAKILNRHGLMPDAKQGTVITDVSRAVRDAKKSHIKFRMDKTAIVHAGLGKVSYSEEALCENIGAFMNAILQAKPAGLKKTSKYAGYVNSFHICSTMGPGLPISIQSLSKAVDHYNKVYLQ